MLKASYFKETGVVKRDMIAKLKLDKSEWTLHFLFFITLGNDTNIPRVKLLFCFDIITATWHEHRINYLRYNVH